MKLASLLLLAVLPCLVLSQRGGRGRGNGRVGVSGDVYFSNTFWWDFVIIRITLLQQDDPAINPEADEIDEDAFKEMFLLSKSFYFLMWTGLVLIIQLFVSHVNCILLYAASDEIAKMVAEAETIDAEFDTVVDVVPGTRELIGKPEPPEWVIKIAV